MRTDGATAALPLNTLEVGGQEFLRVTTTYRNGLHLAGAERGGEEGRSALHPARARIQAGGFSDYDAAALTEAVWARRTMCGLRWEHMATGAAEFALLALDPGDQCEACISLARRAALGCYSPPNRSVTASTVS